MMGAIPEAGSSEFPTEAGLIPRIFSHMFARKAELEGQKVCAGQPLLWALGRKAWGILSTSWPAGKGLVQERTPAAAGWSLQGFGREAKFIARVSMLEIYKEVSALLG